jgi:hypothetical protein
MQIGPVSDADLRARIFREHREFSLEPDAPRVSESVTLMLHFSVLNEFQCVKKRSAR